MSHHLARQRPMLYVLYTTTPEGWWALRPDGRLPRATATDVTSMQAKCVANDERENTFTKASRSYFANAAWCAK